MVAAALAAMSRQFVNVEAARPLVSLPAMRSLARRQSACFATSSYNNAPEMRAVELNGSSPAVTTAVVTDVKVVSTSSSATKISTTPTSYRVSLFDALKIFGPGPERINGRLAMIMLYYAAKREMETGDTIIQQMSNPDWRLVIFAAVVIYATMVPVLKGAKEEDFGWLTVRAEKVNGRMAMLGWASLIALEFLADGACFF